MSADLQFLEEWSPERMDPGTVFVLENQGKLGHADNPFVAVMSKGNSEERARMIRALGGEVLLVDQLPDSKPGQVSGGDLERVEQAAAALTQARGAFRQLLPGIGQGKAPRRAVEQPGAKPLLQPADRLRYRGP